MPIPRIEDALSPLIELAIAEDVGEGDITSELLIPESLQAEMHFVARERMVACAGFIPGLVYAQLGAGAVAHALARDGDLLNTGDTLAIAKGSARALLTGERIALNLLQRACGVATLTKSYVEAVSGTKAIILDTRKTMPGLRMLDKYAVQAGGGQNHRMGLWDMVLIKDNHIALAGSIVQAVARARSGAPGLPVVVECDTLEQVQEALHARPDRVLLDNMDCSQLREAVRMAKGEIKLEASGGIHLGNVRDIADTGVDCISIGKLTHSARNVDIAGDILLKR